MNKEELYLAEDNLAAEIEEISEFVFNHAELGSEEFKSCKYLVEKLKEHGFTVTCPYLDLDTAFRAELYCGEGPKVAVLPEYDALPGYGPNKDEVAHACGHNWIAASTLGAALTLAKFKDQINGTIVVIGAPAEETTGGKCDIANRGGYDDIDAALQFHLGAENNMNIMTLAMDSIEFRFHGTASHAAAYPEKGVNALDAVNLMFAGINAMRQQTRNDARVAGIITSGGAACNIIPDYAACQFYIRAKDRAYLEELTQKVINCAKGAELMTGAKLEYFNFENSYDDLVYHDGLRALMRKNLNDLGVTDFVDSDEEASGSSDIGNVSHVCPTVYCELDTGATESICTSRDISEICTWKNGTPYTSYRHKSIGSYRAGRIRKSGHCKVIIESTKNPVDIVFHIHICRIFIFLIFLFFYILKTLPPASYVSSYAAFLLR